MREQILKLLVLAQQNRKVLLLSGGVLFLIGIFAPQIAHAIPLLIPMGFVAADYLFNWGVTDSVLGFAAKPIASGVAFAFNILLGTIATLLHNIYGILARLLNSMIEYSMNTPVSPSSPDIAPFVKEAWTFSLSLVNGLFLLILVFIGLATIFGWQSYKMQRTLPALVGVALLVNFSGVFVGLVVDIANLFTNYFLSKAAGVPWAFNPFGAMAPSVTKLAENVARIFYFLVGSLIFFVIMFLFWFRTIVLWVVAITAPLAFACLILPGTRKWWQQWLSALFQWSFIGLPISFFMYLAGHALIYSFPGGNPIPLELASALAPLTAIVLLIIGIGISMSLAPAWGRRLALLGAGAGIAGATLGGYVAWRKWGQNVEGGLGKGKKKLQQIGIRAEEAIKGNRVLGKVPGLGWAAKRGVGLATTTVGLAEGGATQISSLVGAGEERRIAAAKRKAARFLTPKDLVAGFNRSINRGDTDEAIGILEHGVENGNPQDLEEALGPEGNLDLNKVSDTLRSARGRRNPAHHRLLTKGFIGHMDEFVENGAISEEDRENIYRRITPDDFRRGVIAPENLDLTSAKTDADRVRIQRTIDGLLTNGDQDLLGPMIQSFRRPERRRAFRNYLASKGEQFWIDNELEHVPRWFNSNVARNMGLGPLGNLTNERIDDLAAGRNPESSEELQTKLENLHTQLLSARGQDRQRIQRQIDQINETLRVRRLDDGDIGAELYRHEGEISRVSALAPEQRTTAQWTALASARHEKDKLQRELTRRTGETELSLRERAEKARLTGIPELEAPGVRMVQLEEKIAKLQDQVAKKPDSIGNRWNLWKAQRERRHLQEYRNDMPPEVLTQDNELLRIEKALLDNQKNRSDTARQIRVLRQANTSESEIQPFITAEQTLQQDLRNLQEEKRQTMRLWQDVGIEARGQTVQGAAENLVELQRTHRKFDQERVQRTANRDDPARIQEARDVMTQIQSDRENANRLLTAMVQTERLRREAGAAPQARANEIRREIGRLKRMEGDWERVGGPATPGYAEQYFAGIQSKDPAARTPQEARIARDVETYLADIERIGKTQAVNSRKRELLSNARKMPTKKIPEQ